MTHFVQQLGSGHPRQPLSRKDQGDPLTAGRKVLQAGTCLVRRSHAHDAVVPRVAVAQLPLDVPECVRVLVDGDKHRPRHALHSSAGPPHT